MANALKGFGTAIIVYGIFAAFIVASGLQYVI